MSCDRIVDDDIVPATVIGISNSGLGLRTGDDRPRVGDRFRLDIHPLGARLQTDVRVRRVSARSDGVELGCSIIASPHK